MIVQWTSVISHGPTLPVCAEFSSYTFLQISALQVFYNTVGRFYNCKMSLAVFPHAFLPWVACATFHMISDTVFVRAGDPAAAGTPGARGCARWPRSPTSLRR